MYILPTRWLYKIDSLKRSDNFSLIASSDSVSNNVFKPFNPNFGYGRCKQIASKSLNCLLFFSKYLSHVVVRQPKYCSVENLPSTKAY